MKTLMLQLFRYSWVGIFNTGLGLFVIWGLMLFGIDPYLANIAGYAAGLTLSFFLNRSWTFRGNSDRWPVVKYLLAFAAAYAANLAILALGISIAPNAAYFIQFAAISGYSILFFFLCRYYVFSSPQAPSQEGIMTSIYSTIQRVGLSSNFALLCLACAAVIAGSMSPVSWSGNEINYFDLAYRFVQPESFGPNHSVFDSSNGRFASFLIIGSGIQLLGFETAKTVFAVLLWVLLAVGLARVAQSLQLGLAETVVGLSIMVLNEQSLLGGEWIFGTFEAKLFAYAAVLFGLGFAFSARWYSAIICVALGTYFHFLVGGFWALALLLLHALSPARGMVTVRLTAMFSILVLPIFLVLLFERIDTNIDLTGLAASVNEIYVMRSSHHIAPFEKGLKSFYWLWFYGILAHTSLSLVLWWIRPAERGLGRQASTWLALLNLYIVAAILLAFLDRDTHFLAPFYLFRPSALIFLLSCLLVTHNIARSIRPAEAGRVAAAMLIAAVMMVLPKGVIQTGRFALSAADQRLEASLTPSQTDLVAWLKTHTQTDTAILLEPKQIDKPTGLEGEPPLGGLERLTGRPFIVNYKFVPTDKADLVTWRRRLLARRDFFISGDCSQLDELQAGIVVFVSPHRLEDLAECVQEVYRNEEFIVSKPREALMPQL
jgi:putative flippase GtrA